MSKKTKRHESILTALEENPTMRSAALAEKLGVSQETVRRDLSELEAGGKISRTYGGAVRNRTPEPGLEERMVEFVAERQGIASLALDMIGDIDNLYIGGGATTLHFARALRATKRRITVITAAFSVASELAANPLIQVMALPGIVEPSEGLVHGPETVAAIANYQTGLAVVGASGVNADGPSDALLHAAEVYAAMIQNADETFVLADHSKFNRRLLRLTSGWSPTTTLVCDRMPDKALATAIRDAGATIKTA